MKHRALSANRGFTLIEVLVSSAVLGIVLAVMFAALGTSLSLWRNTDNKIVADREARAVELMLVRDLANVVVPSETNFWPRVEDNGQRLKLLTLMPSDAQGAAGGQLGDVCYVEYAVLPSTNGPGKELRRVFWPSRKTFDDVLSKGAFPAPPSAGEFQSLGLYLLERNNMAARGLTLAAEANNTNFVLLGTNMLPLAGTLSASNYPTVVEVNFAVADPDTLSNTNIVNNPDYILRNAGLYSFRVPLPRPSSQ